MKKCFMNVSKALTVQNDLLYKGSRDFIPTTCRKEVMEKFHDVHQRINASKNLVKNIVWWLFMDNDIEQFVENCPECSKNRPKLTDSTDK